MDGEEFDRCHSSMFEKYPHLTAHLDHLVVENEISKETYENILKQEEKMTEKTEKVNESQIDFLKPCPFCGSKNVHTIKDHYGHWSVQCWERGCRAEYGNHKYPFIAESDAIDGWNRRVKE